MLLGIYLRKNEIFWPSDAKSWLTWKDPEAGKVWGQEEKGATENEMVGWHHQLNRHEFEQIPGDSEGQGSLACCGPWGIEESDMTEWQINNNLKLYMYPNIHSNTVYNNQDMEANQMSINRQTGKEDTHTHTEEYYSVKKKIKEWNSAIFNTVNVSRER